MGNAKTKAQNKYIAKKYDRINLLVGKGKKAEYTAHAQRREESLTGFIVRAIESQIARDEGIEKQEDTEKAPPV